MTAARFTDQQHTRGIFIRPSGEETHGSLPPGAGDLRAEYEAWLAAGNTPDPYVAPDAPPSSFLARDLIDLITPDDLRAIQTAVQADAALDLLWLRLRTREGKPVVAEGEAFAQGWAGLMAALGSARAAQISAALGIGG
jgi:hypothetical protein